MFIRGISIIEIEQQSIGIIIETIGIPEIKIENEINLSKNEERAKRARKNKY
jgi:hypothetical protein